MRSCAVVAREHQSKYVALTYCILVYSKMTERLELRYSIRLYQKLGDISVETVQNIQQIFKSDAIQ